MRILKNTGQALRIGSQGKSRIRRDAHAITRNEVNTVPHQYNVKLLVTLACSLAGCSARRVCRKFAILTLLLTFSTQASYGYPRKILHGHNHFVSDVVISSDGQFALSSSWDKTLRLWDLNTGATTRRFVGHTGDVLSVSFSADNRQIVSGSRDRTIKLWNTLGDCKFDIRDEGHSDWISCVRFSPNPMNPVIVSAGWDKVVKVGLLWSFIRFSSPPLASACASTCLHLKDGTHSKHASICRSCAPSTPLERCYHNQLYIYLLL